MLPVRILDDEVPEGFTRPPRPIAADQPQYEPLPALHGADGATLARWRFTPEEREAIADGANLDVTIYTFGRPLQPHTLDVQGCEHESPPPRQQVIDENRPT